MLLCPFRVGNADPETFFQMMVQRMGFELFCSEVMIEFAERAAQSRNTTLARAARESCLLGHPPMPVQTLTDQWHPGAREYFCELSAENCSGLLEIVPGCSVQTDSQHWRREKLCIAAVTASNLSRVETSKQ